MSFPPLFIEMKELANGVQKRTGFLQLVEHALPRRWRRMMYDVSLISAWKSSPSILFSFRWLRSTHISLIPEYLSFPLLQPERSRFRSQVLADTPHLNSLHDHIKSILLTVRYHQKPSKSTESLAHFTL